MEQGGARAFAEPQAVDKLDLATLPLPLLQRIKIAANRRDVPYQSLIKAWLAEKVQSRVKT